MEFRKVVVDGQSWVIKRLLKVSCHKEVFTEKASGDVSLVAELPDGAA